MIYVLGLGCDKCEKQFSLVEQAINESGKHFTLEKLDDPLMLGKYGVMTTPALVISDEVVSKGRVLKLKEIVVLLKEYSCKRVS